MSERKRGTEHLITSEEARQRFLLTEAGLLYTSGPLDREERDSYMFTILLGRKGLPRGFRGQQAIQVKVGFSSDVGTVGLVDVRASFCTTNELQINWCCFQPPKNYFSIWVAGLL